MPKSLYEVEWEAHTPEGSNGYSYVRRTDNRDGSSTVLTVFSASTLEGKTPPTGTDEARAASFRLCEHIAKLHNEWLVIAEALERHG